MQYLEVVHTYLIKFYTFLLVSESASDETAGNIFAHLEAKNSREIHHYITYESNKIPWNKIMNFQEPTVKIFCPDLIAVRNTFRSVITVRLIYTLVMSVIILYFNITY